MRLAVFSDYSYSMSDGQLFAEMSFARFVLGLAPHCQRLVVIGRLDRSGRQYAYRMDGVEFVPLPHYDSGADLVRVLRVIPAGARQFWRALDDVDTVWLMGPNPPQTLVFAVIAMLRRRRLVLGVRQRLLQLMRYRYPHRRLVQGAAAILEAAFRMMAVVVPVVAVGPDIAHQYRRAAKLHVLYVSLYREADIVSADEDHRDYQGTDWRILSVGRLDPEKNPLLLADILKQACDRDRRWRLEVCGDGPLTGQLARRLEDLGIADRATLHGYVAIDSGLWELYRRSHVLLHVSFTEGFPQVLLEAFAARLPVVATAVGGVPGVVQGRGWLVPPGDAPSAVAALTEVVEDVGRREAFVERAVQEAGQHTLERECARLAVFLADGDTEKSPNPPLGTAD